MSAAGDIRVSLDPALVALNGGRDGQIAFVLAAVKRALEQCTALPARVEVVIGEPATVVVRQSSFAAGEVVP